MTEKKLVTPKFRIWIGDTILDSGFQAECYSSTAERCSWGTVELKPVYDEILQYRDMEPARMELGYEDDYDTVLSGYLSVRQPDEGGSLRILDDTVFLQRTEIRETFLSCRPQNIIAYALRKAGITAFQLSDAVYPEKDKYPVLRKNVVELIQDIQKAWGINADFYFKDRCFYWGTDIPQTSIYILEEGKNILSLLKFNREYEIKTIGVPWIHQGEQIQVKHRKYTGTVKVTATRIKADDEGCVRMYLTFKGG